MAHSGQYITLYHYTSTESVNQIKAAGRIRASDPDGKDAVYGEGVYLTSLGPEHGKTKLSKNNWDGRRVVRNRLEAYVKLNMPLSNVADVSGGNRDIFLYRGDIVLSGYRWEVGIF